MADTGWKYAINSYDHWGWSTTTFTNYIWAEDSFGWGSNQITPSWSTAKLNQFGFVIPVDQQVVGIEFYFKAKGVFSNTRTSTRARLSWDGGVSWTSYKSINIYGDVWQWVSLGGATDKWGQNWTLSQVADANFVCEWGHSCGGAASSYDVVWMKIYYELAVVSEIKKLGDQTFPDGILKIGDQTLAGIKKIGDKAVS